MSPAWGGLLVVACVCALTTGAAGQAGPSGADRELAWAAWWERNQGLFMAAPTAVDAKNPLSPFGNSEAQEGVSTLWADEDPAFALTRLGEGGSLETRISALLSLGARGDRAAEARLLEVLTRGGEESHAAAMALGVCRTPVAHGYLRSLFEDRGSGRALAGSFQQPVPLRLRIAAALGLGVSGEPRAFALLRRALKDPEIPDSLAAAAAVSLSLSPLKSDGKHLVETLKDSPAGSSLIGVLSAGVGRSSVRIPGTDRLLLRSLRAPGGQGPEGAAVAFWHQGMGTAAGVAAALRRSAASSPAGLSRALSTLALAGRGDPGALAAADRLLQDRTPEMRPFAILAYGLLGRSKPQYRSATYARLGRASGAWPQASRAGRVLWEKPGPTRLLRGRSLADLAGRNVMTKGLQDLDAVLALTLHTSKH